MSWTTSKQLDHSELFRALRAHLRQTPGQLRERLASGLLEAVRSGQLSVGSRLPSERLLSDELGVSRGTVVAALDHLVRRGVLERRQGSGTYVRSAPVSVTAQADEERWLVDRWLKHSTPLDLAISSTIEAPTGLLGDFPATALMTAEPSTGYSAVGERNMREVAARRLESHGVPSLADDVMVTTGAQQALGLAIDAMVRPGDRVLVESPTYPGILALVRRAGAVPVPIRTDAHGLIPSELRRAVAEVGPALLCSQPVGSNPTGAVVTPERREELLDIVVKNSLVVIEDLTLADLVFADVDTALPLNASPDVEGVVTGSSSKTLWGGLRVGWLRADEPWLSRLVQAKALQDFGTSPITQHLTAQLMTAAEEHPTWMNDRLADLSARCDHLINALKREIPSWGMERPIGGLSLWVRTPGLDAQTLSDAADRHGVHVMPGDQCGVDGAFSDYVRLCFDRDPKILDEAVTRLAAANADVRRTPSPQRVLLRP